MLRHTTTPRVYFYLLLLLFLLLFFIGYVNAQNSTIYGNVYDNETTVPIEGAQIEVAFVQNRTITASTLTDSEGYFEINELFAGSYQVKADATDYIIETENVILGENESKEVDFRLKNDRHDEKDEALGADNFPLCFQSVMLVTIILIITLTMYSKIKRENLLNNAIRNRILEYIKENPGKHYRAILKDLDLPMGVLTYHINRLEKAQYLNSRQDGMYRRFFVKGPKTEIKFFLSDIQESILSVIKENKGISQTKIADKIGVSRKVVNYHVNILNQAGIILVESNGRESACYFVNS
jgi:predicted transcriptional regulator